MDISKDINTHLLLTYGTVQTSPAQAAALNSQSPLKFASNVDSTSTPAGYQITLTGYAEFVRLAELSKNTYSNLNDLLKSLRSVPRPPYAKILKGSVSVFKLENRLYRVDYRIASGEVLVYNIQPTDRLQQQRDRMEQPALYRVKRNAQGFWQVNGKTDKITTAHAAVNGQSNNLTKATWLMGSHLEFEFKNLQEYTLFHNASVGGLGDTWESLRDKMGFTTPVTKRFAKILAESQAQGTDIQWVAHSQGGAIFAEGVRYLLNGSSSWALHNLQLNGLRNANKGALLNKHSVAFHANANNNLRSEPLFDRAGVKVLAIRANDYDIVPNLIGVNTLNPRKLIGSILYSGHVFSGSVAQSPHTLMQTQKDWEQAMDSGPGAGRNGAQQLFNRVDKQLQKIRSKPNYLP